MKVVPYGGVLVNVQGVKVLRRELRAATCSLLVSREHMHMRRGTIYVRNPGCQAAGPWMPWKYRTS